MRWWMPPVIGVGAVAIANVALFTAVWKAAPGKVEDSPYAASAHEDERRAAAHACASRGWRLTATADGGGAVHGLAGGSGPALAAGQVLLYRPDAPAADRVCVWADPARPLRVELPRPGAWTVVFTGHDAAGTALAAEIAVLRP